MSDYRHGDFNYCSHAIYYIDGERVEIKFKTMTVENGSAS